jgi:hypothetical protein
MCAYRALVGKPEVKTPLGRPIGVVGTTVLGKPLRNKMDCIELALERDKRRAVVKAAMNLLVP